MDVVADQFEGELLGSEIASHDGNGHVTALPSYLRSGGHNYAARPALTAIGDLTLAPDDSAVETALTALVASFTRRCDVATLIRVGGIGVELGVAAGDFSARILERSGINYLYSIDMWEGDRGHDVGQYREAITRLHPHRARNALLRMRFDEALALFGDCSLDFIYVDGYAHTGEENGRTIADWYPKLRPGGIIAGDDYHLDWPLVTAAVDAFAAENGLTLHVINVARTVGTRCTPPGWR